MKPQYPPLFGVFIINDKAEDGKTMILVSLLLVLMRSGTNHKPGIIVHSSLSHIENRSTDYLFGNFLRVM